MADRVRVKTRSRRKRVRVRQRPRIRVVDYDAMRKRVEKARKMVDKDSSDIADHELAAYLRGWNTVSDKRKKGHV